MLILTLPMFLILIGLKTDMPALWYAVVAFVTAMDILMSLAEGRNDENDADRRSAEDSIQ